VTAKKQSPPAPDVVTLADLAPRQDVKGGSQRRVFGSDPVQPDDAPGAQRRDLPAKSPGSAKGGGISRNANITLLRNARPAAKRKDLRERRDIKGGKKRSYSTVTKWRRT
jgi:hypothetical protein